MSFEPFYLQEGNIYAVPALHYTMESAATVNAAFHEIKPDVVAVELPELLELQILHAASRLPDISVIQATPEKDRTIYFMAQGTDPAFEALRLAAEKGLSSHAIDLMGDDDPFIHEPLPDPYSIQRIGMKAYYEAYLASCPQVTEADSKRELYMARRLKELSFRYDKVLFVGGMHHVKRILELTRKNAFETPPLKTVVPAQVLTLTDKSAREVMAECGYIEQAWESARGKTFPDRQKIWLELLKEAQLPYEKESGVPFAGYHIGNILKFARNWAFIRGKLLPDLFQLVTAAKSSVDSNYGYHVWKLATDVPFLKNVDNLPKVELSPDDVWGSSQKLHFQLKQSGHKKGFFSRRKKDSGNIKLTPVGPFSLCSYPPEDVQIETFGDHVKKKGVSLLSEEGARTIPFSTSLEDGIDTKETIRHRPERKLYVKTQDKPPGEASSVVVIFDEDDTEEAYDKEEKFPWKMTWIGEHSQESDMAFYATPMNQDLVGPGISRSLYGGLMLTSPPRRLMNVWEDPDYFGLKTKAEVLLAAAIDYAVKPIIVYVAKKAPRSKFKAYAARFGKKVVFVPIGQLSPVTLNKLRAFHVLDSHKRRGSADDYIF